MKNPKLLMWGGFFGAIIVVLIIVWVVYLKDENKMAELGKTYASWTVAEGKLTQFQARFPKEPEYASQDLPIPDSDQVMRQEIYVGGDDDMSYFVSATLYPAEISGDEEANLRQALDGMAKSIPEGEIISSSYTVPVSGANYLEYKIHSNANNLSFKGRLFLSARSLYQVYVSFPEAAYSEDKYTFFANSFEVK